MIFKEVFKMVDKETMSFRRALYTCNQLTHECNLTYGKTVNKVKDDRPWEKLEEDERLAKMSTFKKIAELTEFKTADGAQSHLDAPFLHYLWMKDKSDNFSKDVDHPCFKPWEELSKEDQFKDYIYLAFIELYKKIRHG